MSPKAKARHEDDDLDPAPAPWRSPAKYYPDYVNPDFWKMDDDEFEPSIADFREAPTI